MRIIMQKTIIINIKKAFIFEKYFFNKFIFANKKIFIIKLIINC